MTEPTPRFFVTGATGYTGRHVVSIARELGIDTVAHVRPDSRSLADWQERFSALGATVDTSPWTDEAFAAALQAHRPTHVFALLGTTRARKAKGMGSAVAETYEAVDYGLSALLLRACALLETPPTYVFLSSLGVKPGTRNAYMAARAKLEAELREGSVPWLIVRPSFISGDDRDEKRIGERVASVIGDAAFSALRAFGARDAHARFRTRSGEELGRNVVDAALYATPGSELDGPQLDALAR